MTNSDHLFWDSCVFIRYLTREPDENLGDIDDYIEDAKNRRRSIYYSTLILAEIRPVFLQKKYGTIRKFLDDLKGSFYPIEPNPNILIAAGELKGSKATNPGNPKDPKPRVVGTADAIHLMSCWFAKDTLKIPDIVFHTYDNGKGATWEGKCIPLLSFEDWFPEKKRSTRAAQVCDLVREPPLYPQLNLLRSGNDQQPDAGTSQSIGTVA
jgi:predicted nucleic acid-binding protein